MDSDESKRDPEETGEGGDRPTKLFREEALQHYLGEGEEGEVLRLSPAWTRWTYWLLVLVVVAGVVYLGFGSTAIYEGGPAILLAEDRTSLSSELGGTVESVEVRSGEAVTRGQILVRFREEEQRAESARIRREFELHLLQRLSDPGDPASADALRRLRGQWDEHQSRLEQRRIRAPRSGVVSDVRIRPGQHLERGVPALSLLPEQPEFRVVAMLPGHTRPLLDEGMRIRLDIQGYPYAEVWTTIERVGDQVVAPGEARRYLGPEIADSVGVAGPVILVEARLESNTFTAWGREYSLHDGMLARAEARVRTERLLFRLVPGLKTLARERNA